MKRDMDLVRQILIEIEAGATSSNLIDNINWPDAEVIYHTKIMADFGLIDARLEDISTYDDVYPRFALCEINGISWEGHDFLDDIRNETVWKKTQTQIKKTTGTASLEMVKEVAKTFVREMLLSGLT